MPLSLTEVLEQGPVTSKDIQAATGMSQAAVSRQLRRLEHRVVTTRSGRTPKYIMTKDAFGGNDRLPLTMVDVHGNTVPVADIRPLVNGGFYIEPTSDMSSLLLGDSGDGLYDDLPYFLQDIGPQGFIGRQIARKMNAQFPSFHPDPRFWSADQIGRYLVSNGDDLPGNFKFGEQSILRVRRKPDAVEDADYPILAEKVLEGEVPGSSAGGEQPKFTAFSQKKSSHVIVKFSPPDNNEVSRRWRDILITEFHAIETMRRLGFSVAETRLLDVGGRLFLESKRFDRSGEYGRMSMVSLTAIDAEFVGMGSNWPRVLKVLLGRKMIDVEDLLTAGYLWDFGKLINNTDMHLGNISFSIEGDMFKLLPVYDMCSMGFAPRNNGEVLAYDFTPQYTESMLVDDSKKSIAKRLAVEFWDTLFQDDRISDEFRNFLSRGNPVEMMG